VPHLEGCEQSFADEETPHGCYNGWIYLDFATEDETGEHTRGIDLVPCRRCIFWSHKSPAQVTMARARWSKKVARKSPRALLFARPGSGLGGESP